MDSLKKNFLEIISINREITKFKKIDSFRITAAYLKCNLRVMLTRVQYS
jgi:hypothetical protein